MLQLEKLPTGNDSKLPFLALEDSVAADKAGAELGTKIFARMVQDWKRTKKVVEAIRFSMRDSGFSNRLADTLGGPIGFAWSGLHDGEITEAQANEWVAGFDLSESRAKVAQNNNSSELLSFIMSQSVLFNGKNFLLSQLAQLSLAERRTNAAKTALAQYGIRADKMANSDYIAITVWTKSPQLREVLRRSKWSKSDIGNLLTQCQGAMVNTITKKIAGQNYSGTIMVPTDISASFDYPADDDDLDFGITAETAAVCAHVSNMAI